MDDNKTSEAAGIDGYLFRLIATFEAAAMQQLGKIAHPLTGDVETDLAGAGDSIEMLAAIQRKTEGNLNADEKRLLDHVLYQLRMNFVDVNREQAEAGADGATGGEADNASEPEGGEAGDGTDQAPDAPDGGSDEDTTGKEA